jgi:hypothetical protein
MTRRFDSEDGLLYARRDRENHRLENRAHPQMFGASPGMWQSDQKDPYWAQVLFLMRADDGYVDKSKHGYPITVGSTQGFDTGIKKFGTRSFDFTGGTPAGLSTSWAQSIFNPELAQNSQFTFEFWVYSKADTNSSGRTFPLNIEATNGQFVFFRDSPSTTNRMECNIYGAGGTGTYNSSYTNDAWHHVALWTQSTSGGTNGYFALDGVIEPTWGWWTRSHTKEGPWTVNVGRSLGSLAGNGRCLIDQIRLTSAARYPININFDPPTLPFPVY